MRVAIAVALAMLSSGCEFNGREQPARSEAEDELDDDEPSGLGEGRILRGPVEEALPHVVFEPTDRLTDGRLRAVELHGRPREAPLRRHAQEHAQFAQFHI